MEGKSCTLYISSKSWSGIQEQLTKKDKQKRLVDKEKEMKQKKRQLNEEMTKSWPDSKQNVRLRKEQERLQRIEKIKQDRIENFYKLRTEQAEKRKQFVDKTKWQQYMKTNSPRQLNNALLLSACLYERDKQIEFRKFIEQQEKEADQKLLEEKFRTPTDKDVDKRLERQKRADYGDYLRQEMAKNKNNEDKRRKNRIDEELVENQRVNEEIELLKRRNIDNRRKFKAFQLKQYKDFIQTKKDLQQKEMEENEQMDTFNDIYKSTKFRIDCLRKNKEKELRGELEKRQNVIREKFIKLQQEQQQDDDRRFIEQQEELMKKSEQKHSDKLAKTAQLKQERIDDYRQHVERVNLAKQIKHEYKKWEMLNRFKNDENYQESLQKQRQKKLEQIQCYQRELMDQITSDRELKEQQLKDEILPPSSEDKEKKFQDYANEVVEFARQHNFSTYPIEKTIKKRQKLIAKALV